MKKTLIAVLASEYAFWVSHIFHAREYDSETLLLKPVKRTGLVPKGVMFIVFLKRLLLIASLKWYAAIRRGSEHRGNSIGIRWQS